MNQGADIGRCVHTVADAKLLGFFHTSGNELVVDTPLNVAAFDRQASLPGIHVGAPDRPALCDIDVSIF